MCGHGHKPSFCRRRASEGPSKPKYAGPAQQMGWPNLASPLTCPALAQKSTSSAQFAKRWCDVHLDVRLAPEANFQSIDKESLRFKV